MENIAMNYIKEKLKDSYDVKYREIECEAGIIYGVFIDDLCDSKFISEYIFNPLIRYKITTVDIDYLKKEVLYANSIGDVKSNEDAISHVLSGDVVLLFSFTKKAIFCEAKGYVRRSVGIPVTENVIKGPREGFTEAFVDNVSLIRRKIKNPDLKLGSFAYPAKKVY